MVTAEINEVLSTLKEPNFGLASKIEEIERDEVNGENSDPKIIVTVREVDNYVLVELSRNKEGVRSTYVIENDLVKGLQAVTLDTRLDGMYIAKVGIPGPITTQFGLWKKSGPGAEYTILLGAESVGDDFTVTDLQELSLVRNLTYWDSIRRAVPLDKVHLEVTEGYGERWVSVPDNNVYERLDKPPPQKKSRITTRMAR